MKNKELAMYCKHDCKYVERAGQKMASCSYILYNNEPRGCPAGANCTKYTPKKRRNKMNYGVILYE